MIILNQIQIYFVLVEIQSAWNRIWMRIIIKKIKLENFKSHLSSPLFFNQELALIAMAKKTQSTSIELQKCYDRIHSQFKNWWHWPEKLSNPIHLKNTKVNSHSKYCSNMIRNRPFSAYRIHNFSTNIT